MQAATPTITPEELVKRITDPETYLCGSIALLGKVRTSASCPCSLCSPLSPQASRLSDKLLRRHAKAWRETLAAREEGETVPDETATDIISNKLFLSPAKTIFMHKVESGVTPPGASANEAGKHSPHAHRSSWRACWRGWLAGG
jgi:hypothetical protein